MARLRSYLVRATYSWLVDHRMTPYLLVDAEAEGVVVPPAYIEEGQIVLNVSPDAIRNLEITDQAVLFDASFSGEAWSIEVPMEAVVGLYASETEQGIYAHEEGLGMWVDEGSEEDLLDPVPEQGNTVVSISDRAAKRGLRIIK